VTVLAPETASKMLTALQLNFLSIPSKEYPKRTIYRSFREIYDVFGVEYIKPAYATRKGFNVWLLQIVRADPDWMCERLTDLLTGDLLLIDPMTKSAFEWKTIPRHCFPAQSNEQDAKRQLELASVADKNVAGIVREEMAAAARRRAAQEQQPRRDIEEEQALADLDLRLAKQEYHNAMGYEYIDENGVKRGVPGAMNNMGAAN
jgi:hypothetical protein